MNITFDIFIVNPELEDFTRSIPEIDEGFKTIMQFVKGRLMPLSDSIDKEEQENDDILKGTIIMLHPPPEHRERFLFFGGYSHELLTKMEDSFSRQDIDYIFNKLLLITNRLQQ